MLDINLFREDKGGNLEILRESQRRRFAPVEWVDEVVAADNEWRKLTYSLDNLNKEYRIVQKQVAEKKKAKEDAAELVAQAKAIDATIEKTKVDVAESKVKVDRILNRIGNLVHESVPVSKDEALNGIVREHGNDKRRINDGKYYHHHELLAMIDAFDTNRGANVAGHRGYYLKGYGVLLNQALINYGLQFLIERGYTPLHTPFFMKKEIMAETAQLEEFDEALYKVSGDGEDKYLIATSEQPISAYHRGEWLEPKSLPIRYAGYSTCFRKEAGAHGRDAWGIFRVHQFEKIEQFSITSPENSWEEQEKMIQIAEDFYKSLGLSYRVINIVSGELNNAAARKYDLEAWFPTLGVYRELVSCSNCTDYQSRNLEIRYGTVKPGETAKSYAHMLNATLCATERTLCCLMENYQTEDGVRVPEALQPFMGGKTFLPFEYEKPQQKGKGGALQMGAKFKRPAAEGVSSPMSADS
eukprot:TRINITY_DN2032_c0_g2_i1.p1 TRINITY_DN2032_c0_g2~~TRINITY_DN2032_c0_g2_i1.p1  ORF type:complete len:470 (-),score=133.87 TRINITY_DN2032_c0_g2_i1:115-1524(-)